MNLLPSLQARAAAMFAGVTFRLVLIAIIAVLFANTYVDVRIPLPLLPDIHWQGWKPEALASRETIKGFAKAQEQARKLAEQQLAAKEQEYRNKAKEADDDYHAALADANDATARYIAAHRLPSGGMQCPSGQGGAGSASAAAESGNPGISASVPADTFVAIRESDVRACGALYTYAVKAHDWAAGLNATH